MYYINKVRRKTVITIIFRCLVINVVLSVIKCSADSSEESYTISTSTLSSSFTLPESDHFLTQNSSNLYHTLKCAELHDVPEGTKKIHQKIGKSSCQAGRPQRLITIHKNEFKVNESHSDWFSILDSTYKKEEFCIKSIEGEMIKIVMCPFPKTSSTGKGEIHFHKCCKPNERIFINPSISSESKYTCVPVSNDTIWEPAIFNSIDDDYAKHIHFNSSAVKVDYEFGFPNCTHLNELDNNRDIWFKILKDGRVFIGLKFWFRAVWLPVSSDNQGFCTDELVQIPSTSKDDFNKTEENISESSHEEFHRNQILLYCQIQNFDEYLFHRKLFGSLCVTASLIILILLIIYISIWDKQNLAGWTQFNIFVTVFFVFGMEGMRTLVDYNGLLVESTTTCVIIAAIAQYFFFALNTTWSVMNFDLFWTFWKLESSVKVSQVRPNRIIGYLLFSWVLPLLIVAVAFGISHNTANSGTKAQMEGVFAFAHRRCSSPIRELGFQTQGIMFVVNLCFFFCTGFLIWKHRRGINANRRNSKSERHTWRSVMLFVKLLIVMGVSSLSIPLDVFFGSEDPLSRTEVIFRAIHFIPVVAILFIFGFNDKNIRLIKQKYPKFAEIFGLSMCNVKNTSETNPSRSGGPHSTTNCQNAS